jgi:hypothetical protein
MNRRRSLLAAMAVAFALPLSSCSVYEEPGTPAAAETYSPDYFQGNVVYFDNDEPYYYVGDEPRYVPQESPDYARFREHHVRFGVGYRRWVAGHPPSGRLPTRRAERREERREEHEERHHRD